MRTGPVMFRWLLWLACACAVLTFILYQLLKASPDPHRNAISIKSEYLPYRFHRPKEKRRIFSPMATSTQSSTVLTTELPFDAISFSPLFWRLVGERAINSTVVVSIVDSDYFSFAVNFYQFSIVKQDIRNFLAICLDDVVSQQLSARGIPCALVNVSLNIGSGASDYGAKSYYQKTNLKTYIMLELLRHKYSVLLTDLDVTLFRDPWPHFTCTECDLHFQMDRVLLNSGFVFARPTPGSIQLYSKAWQYYVQYNKAHDQAYINMAARELTQKKLVRIHELPRKTFACGVYYFQQDGRMFYNHPPCEQCIMAHNNYIGSVSAKIYRLRENLLWVENENHYYDDPQRRYLTFTADTVFHMDAVQIEMHNRALKNALYISQLLNRTLIVPHFRCCDCRLQRCDLPRHRCSLLSVLRLKTFDKYFRDEYREHSFLKHPLVPSSIHQSVSPFINVSSTNLSQVKHTLQAYAEYAVMNMSALYGQILYVNEQRWQRVSNAVECSDYEQWQEGIAN
ncbi:hypothetical protein CAPTEDRAFT_218172 [Capitella teleta]|uniref:Nucleotide-diphospho-sugar transferase domain-containing protein n=1 Tax=Capitella teleta TaxID=283909 RepID=R7TVP7_CAPTE|nr:hypothetical protein CAPTEDRAFT_218172 [Capitella teleta]|eukprot:ELT97963.1 hypothetical protein CAPTEDRAFT_218172 [Capitella teleta]